MSVTRRIENNVGAGAIMPQIELFGDWALTQRMLATLPATLKIATGKASRSAADKLRYQVRKNIRENGATIGWEPLGEKYKKQKGKKGHDPTRRLYATGLYYNNIKKWNIGNVYYVGVKRGIKHPGGNMTVGQIARLLESGSVARTNIPARPLWTPSYRQFGGHKRMKGIVLWHIRNEIYVKYGVRPRITL